MSSTLLQLRNLEVSYGGIAAVKGIDLCVARGELVCLIGANGAGKTSALKAVAGLLPVSAERIRYDGEAVGGVRAFELVRRGLALVPEGRGVFGQLTVEENLAMGAYMRNDTAGVKRDLERVYSLFARLAERRTQSAGTLSGGEQQMLAIGRALMLNPKLLLLDEPLEGLAPLIVQELLSIIQQLTEESGMAVILVEQHARQILPLTQQALVLERGKGVYLGAAQTLLDDSALLDSWLGVAAH